MSVENQPPVETPPNPTPAPPAAPPKPAGVSPEFLKKAGIIPKEPTAAPAPPEPPKAPDAPSAPPEAPPEPKPKKAPKIAKGYAQPAPATIEQITAAATAAATAAVKANQPPPEPTPELTPEDQRQIRVYEVMASMNPDKYKDLPANATKYIRELDQRETEWRREHPDATEEFDADGTIAANLEKKYKLQFAEHDFRDAEIESRIAPVKAELETTRQKLAEAETVISTEAVQATMQKAVNEAKSVLRDELGIKADELAKLAEDEPFVARVVNQEMEAVENIVAAAHIAFAGGEHPLANQVGQMCANYEKAMMQLPPEEQQDEHNRQFITRAQYLTLPRTEQRAIDQGKHKQYWGMNAPTAAAIGTQIIKERAKKLVKSERELAQKYMASHGIKPPAPAAPPAPTAPRPAAPALPPPPRRVSPPSTNPSSSTAPATTGITAAPNFMKRFLGNGSFGVGAVPTPKT